MATPKSTHIATAEPHSAEAPAVVSTFEALKISTDLLINTSKLVQGWITRFVFVNAALCPAASVLLSWDSKEALPILAAVCIFGFVTSVLMLMVFFRQNEWQRATQRLVLDHQKRLNTKVHPLPTEVQGGEYTEIFAWVIGIAVIFAWPALLVFVLLSRS